MIGESPTIRTPNLEQVLEQRIQRRTFGRVRHIQIENYGDRIVVRGWTNSYYVVQLVVVAIREVLPTTPVNLNIQVGSDTRPRMVEGHDQ